MTTPRTLATDLDGTFIPLPGNADNQEALKALARIFEQPDCTLIYASGRSLKLVEEAIREVPLPPPDWIVADVGVSIHQPGKDGFIPVRDYETHLETETAGMLPAEVAPYFGEIPGLRKQPAAGQAKFKLSYFCDPELLEETASAVATIVRGNRMPFAATSSVDPEGAVGLIDILPVSASKKAALLWLCEHAGIDPKKMIYAGDSGNDRAALTSGLLAILVGNAPDALAEDVSRELAGRDALAAFYRAKAPATSGVLEGCRHFGLGE